MPADSTIEKLIIRPQPSSYPTGRNKIAKAFRKLMEEKDFSSITTAEISRTAGVNESLIYRYFNDKRGLLHTVLADDLYELVLAAERNIEHEEGILNKLKVALWRTVYYYHQNRVMAKILLLEVRSFPGYFECETYLIVRYYGKLILRLINEGVREGVIRKDIDPVCLRQILFGSLEHLCLPAIIFNKKIDHEKIAESIYKIVLKGVTIETEC